MRGVRIILSLAACMLAAGCGDTETTVINQTTSVAPGTSALPVPTATTPTVAPTTPTPPELVEPEQKGAGDARDYTGPCGQPGSVTGGTPGTSATTAKPGFTNLQVRHSSCTFATTVATAWTSQWDSSCASGCTSRVQGLSCDYGGSGTSVVCRDRNAEIRFDLAFQFE